MQKNVLDISFDKIEERIMRFVGTELRREVGKVPSHIPDEQVDKYIEKRYMKGSEKING